MAECSVSFLSREWLTLKDRCCDSEVLLLLLGYCEFLSPSSDLVSESKSKRLSAVLGSETTGLPLLSSTESPGGDAVRRRLSLTPLYVKIGKKNHDLIPWNRKEKKKKKKIPLYCLLICEGCRLNALRSSITKLEIQRIATLYKRERIIKTPKRKKRGYNKNKVMHTFSRNSSSLLLSSRTWYSSLLKHKWFFITAIERNY